MLTNSHSLIRFLLSCGQHSLFVLGTTLFFLFGEGIAAPPSPLDFQSVLDEHNKRPSLIPQKQEQALSFAVFVKTSLRDATLINTDSPLTSPETKTVLSNGKQIYQEHCANCHGIEGDGQGPVASDLSTPPQNFVKGVYKFRSTPSGELPTDDDLLRTISRGIPGTPMESYEELPSGDRLALVAYIKSFSPRFLKRQPGTPILLPPARPLTPESLVRGKHLFEQMVCAACHGATGKGDGELAQELTNTAGEPIRPADLTQRKLKSGLGPKAIYRTIMTGLDGTPMPSYGDSLSPEEGWDLALYIYSLAEPKETS